jgi:hypothetical protein
MTPASVIHRAELSTILNLLPRKCANCKLPGDVRCDCGMMNFCQACASARPAHRFCQRLCAIMESDNVDVDALVCLLVSVRRGNSLNFVFHLLQHLSLRDLHCDAMTLLPEVAMMTGRLEMCHDMIVLSRLQAQHLCKTHFETQDASVSLIQIPIYSIMAEDPLCHDKILILNLLMLKLVFKKRNEEMQTLHKVWHGRVSDLNLVGGFLGAHSKWMHISLFSLEKTCMDLVKLLFLLEPQFVPSLVRKCQDRRVRIMLRTVSTTSIHAIRHWLVYSRLIENEFIVDFLKDLTADFPQGNFK